MSGPHSFRRATNVELFLDLVFVFAVTQIATVMSHDMTLGGFLRSLLLAWLTWWLWSQFAWAGTTVDIEKDKGAALLTLGAVPLALLMGVALPNAYHGTGLLFGASYFCVQVTALVIQGRGMWNRGQRATFLVYALIAGIGPVLVVLGGLLPEANRAYIWVGASLAGILGARLSAQRAGDTQHWNIDPGHFSERHALFVIISLGEVLVAAGLTAFAVDDPLLAAPGLVAGAIVACVLWWMYFAYIPRLAEEALAEEPEGTRSRVARDMFTFGHFPIVFGLIALAVVGKHVVKHPTEPLHAPDLWVFGLGCAAVVGGFMLFHYLFNRGIAWERPIGLLLLAGLITVGGPRVPAWLLSVLVSVGLLVIHAVTMVLLPRRLATGERHRKSQAHSRE